MPSRIIYPGQGGDGGGGGSGGEALPTTVIPRSYGAVQTIASSQYLIWRNMGAARTDLPIRSFNGGSIAEPVDTANLFSIPLLPSFSSINLYLSIYFDLQSSTEGSVKLFKNGALLTQSNGNTSQKFSFYGGSTNTVGYIVNLKNIPVSPGDAFRVLVSREAGTFTARVSTSSDVNTSNICGAIVQELS